MNHRNSLRKLGRSSAHRRSMFRNLATSLVLKDRIETTLHKAKELRRIADGLVTLGKKGTLHARRKAMSYLFAINRQDECNANKLSAVHRLFEEIAPRYASRNGGYTRVVRSRRRAGDNAQMAVIEFVEGQLSDKASSQRRKRRVVRQDVQVAENSGAVVDGGTDTQQNVGSQE